MECKTNNKLPVITLIFTLLLTLFANSVFSQPVSVKKAESNANFPEITWFTTGNVDITDIQIFRATVSGKKFNEIHTLHFSPPAGSSDTVYFKVIDTTLVKKALYVYYINVFRNGKPVQSEMAYGHNFGLLPIPQIRSLKGTAVKDRKAITLSWQLDNPETVSSLSLFRSRSYEKDYVKVTDLSPDMTSYTDVVNVSNEPWFYFMVINDYFGKKFVSVRVPAFATFAEKPVRPQNIHGKYKNNTITLDWKNAGDNIIGFRIFRKIDDKPFRLISEMQENIKEKTVFTDNSQEVKNAIHVSYYVRNVSDGFVESSSSDTLSFYIAEHEPVLPPLSVNTIFQNNGDVLVLWEPPETGFVTGYNIYVKKDNGEPQRLNDKILTVNSFKDTVYRSPGKYTYEVESAGVKNKVSDNRTVAVIHRSPLLLHVVLDLRKEKNGIKVSWKKPLNKHIVSVTVYKKSPGIKTVTPVKSMSNNSDIELLDKNVVQGNTYLYKLVAKMDNGDTVVLNPGVSIKF